MHKRFFIGVVLIIFQVNLYSQSQQFTISGYVYEKGSRETLIGVHVFASELKAGTTSNSYGFYALTMPAGKVQVVFSYVGYKQVVKEIDLTGNIRLDMTLEPAIDLDEVVVTDKRLERLSRDIQMSRLDLPVSQVRNIPALLGEKDMFKVLQLMPGVQSGTEGTSGFYVRGGAPDQNLIILDDATVYNASHLFGFFSVFNGDAIKNMQLYKGGFPARFGGRLSSVLDIQMKDGSKEKIEGEAGIGLISSRLTLEGPVIKEKASFLVSGRRTYIDLLTRPLMPDNSYGGYFFYDLNAKINYDVNTNNRLFLSSYFGRDKFFFKDKYSDEFYEDETEGGLYWQNATATLRWNHLFSDKMFANASFIFSDYTLSIYSEEAFRDLEANETSAWAMQYSSGIQDLGVKYDLSWHPIANHYVRAGFQVLHHRFTPSAVVLKDQDIDLFEHKAEVLNSLESGFYIEDEMRFGDYLSINPGIRLSHFYTNGKHYFNAEPRFAANAKVITNLAWKASFASMNQYVHLLSTTGIGLPTDLWVPSTDRIRPQKTWQLASGFAYDWLDKDIEISLEGYYKKSDDIIGYREGASFLLIDDPSQADDFSWQDNITHGEAWAYGIELLIQKKYGRVSGWVGYTLSWITHRFNALNFGESFPARYDRRHDLSLVGIYEVSPQITFSATWVYATGNVFDLGTGRFPVMAHPVNQDVRQPQNTWWNTANVYDKKNSFRAASYHRLDVGIQFHKEMTLFGSQVHRTIELGAYNAYSRKNPFFYYWQSRHPHEVGEGENGRELRKLMQVSVFPLIPSISFNYKF